MAPLATPTTLLLLLFSSFLVALPPGACGASDDAIYVTKTGLFTVLDCAAGPSSTKNASADLSELLAAIPSVAAPEGFGALSRAAASVRGACLGDFSPETCRTCLIAAAWSVTKGCGLAARSAVAWSDACFVAYSYADAGANASLPVPEGKEGHEHDHDDSNSISTTGTKVLCHGDFSGLYVDGDFSGLQASARQAAASCGGDWSGWVQGGHVLSDGCYLRFAVTSGVARGGTVLLRWVVVAVAALHLHGGGCCGTI